MMVLSCTQLFLNLNDGWKETDIEDLQAKVLQVEGMVKDMSPKETQASVNELRKELNALGNREKIYDTFLTMAGILMIPCALGVIYFRPRLNQPAQVNPCNPPENPRTP